jgi:fatty acid-binding protein DegV
VPKRRCAIVTDTTTDFPPQRAAELEVESARVVYVVDGEEIPIEFHLDAEAFTQKLVHRRQRVTTSGVNAEAWAQAYERALARAPQVLCLTMPRRISSTYTFAITAMELFEPGQVEVFDVHQIGLGEAALVIQAAEMAQQGASREDIRGWLSQAVGGSATYIGGPSAGTAAEIGRLAGEAGGEGYTLQRIGGDLWQTVGQFPNWAEAVDLALDRAWEDVGGGPALAVVAHVHAPEAARRLQEGILRRLPGSRVEVWGTRPTVSFFGGGPGAFSLGVCPLGK